VTRRAILDRYRAGAHFDDHAATKTASDIKINGSVSHQKPNSSSTEFWHYEVSSQVQATSNTCGPNPAESVAGGMPLCGTAH